MVGKETSYVGEEDKLWWGRGQTMVCRKRQSTVGKRGKKHGREDDKLLISGERYTEALANTVHSCKVCRGYHKKKIGHEPESKESDSHTVK